MPAAAARVARLKAAPALVETPAALAVWVAAEWEVWAVWEEWAVWAVWVDLGRTDLRPRRSSTVAVSPVQRFGS